MKGSLFPKVTAVFTKTTLLSVKVQLVFFVSFLFKKNPLSTPLITSLLLPPSPSPSPRPAPSRPLSPLPSPTHPPTPILDSTPICFHSMIPLLDKYTLSEKLVLLLSKIKTKEPGVMIATLAVHEETGKKCEVDASFVRFFFPPLEHS